MKTKKSIHERDAERMAELAKTEHANKGKSGKKKAKKSEK